MPTKLDPERVREALPRYLHGDRLTHTLGVEEEMRYIASFFPAFREETQTVRVAALLHDITKQLDQHTLCVQYGVDETAVSSREVLHALTGSAFAGDVFHAEEDICLAIRRHTTGDAGMSLFEKMLFLADYTEKNRKHENCKVTRQFLHEALESAVTEEEKKRAVDTACVMSIDATLSFLLSSGKPIELCTVAARNDLINAMRQEDADNGKKL